MTGETTIHPSLRTVDWKNNKLVMIDQTKLPNKLVYVEFTDYNEVANAIRNLVGRGAPAIGVSGAFGLALAALQSKATSKEELIHDLEKATHFEITRQESLHSRDIEIIQETRHWDDKRKITISSRSKEEDLDYRYFLEGDIPWVKIDPEIQKKLQTEMPESISSKKERYVSKYNIPTQVADVLSSDKFYSDMFEEAHTDSNAKEVANIITTELMGLEDTREKRETSKLTSKQLKELENELKQTKAQLKKVADAEKALLKA